MNAHQDNPTETRRQAIQAAVDATRSAAERNRLGQFATPNALAIDIARYVDSLIDDRKRAVRFADPSIGSGSFFSAALAVFGPKRIRSAVGVELDPAFCEAARDLWSDTALEIVRGDFIRVVSNASRPPAPNLILANPP
jgi:adenine-specific DNA-methyltransferase